MFVLMGSFGGALLGPERMRRMAAEEEALLFFLRVRVEVGEGEAIRLQCS